ncbi:MAG: tetratricopeptide repeat protein [Chloroflexi bacterium]|nr:tetratricopeptide repeat protein [Chloroflexota bacterium]
MLIWEGAVELLRRDPLRAVVGYGPEAMYVAYNQVYPPDLAHYEARNASPDRAHNETFDALLMTGVLGFLAYFALFGSVFYYSLRWLGMLEPRRDRPLFLGLTVGGACVGALLPRLLDGSFRFSGVGIPAGFIIGVIVYLTAVTVVPRAERQRPPIEESLLILAVLAALVAHFVEIHFGIAVAASRLYFWALTGVLAVVGAGRLAPAVEAPPAAAEPGREPSPRRRRRQRSKAPAPARRSESGGMVAAALPYIAVVAVILATLVYNYVTNQGGAASAPAILWRSFTARVTGPNQYDATYGLLWLVLLTWVVGGLVALAAGARSAAVAPGPKGWSVAAAIYLLVTLAAWWGYGLLHAARMRRDLLRGAAGAEQVANHLVGYFLALALLWGLLALFLYLKGQRPPRRWLANGPLALGLAVLLCVVTAAAIGSTNLSLVQADVFHKQGLTADGYQQWDSSIAFHSEATKRAPNQDYYYLFLGRSQLEKAQTVTDPAAREALIEESERILRRAQELNPLNTDHTANLARLYQVWAQLAADEQTRQERFDQSLAYFQQATTLSPHNAQLFNEWGQTLQIMGLTEEARQRYQQSLALDDEYHITYWLLGQMAMSQNDLAGAETMLGRALEIEPDYAQARSALGVIYARQGRVQEAMEENLRVLAKTPNDYISHRNLAYLYMQTGQLADAQGYAWAATNLAPNQDATMMNDLVLEIAQALYPDRDWNRLAVLLQQARAALDGQRWDQAIQFYQEALVLEPDLLPALNGLGNAYAQKGRYDLSVQANERVRTLAPQAYLSHRNLAVLFRAQGRLSEALAAAEDALPLSPGSEHAALNDLVAQLRAETGR